MKTDEQLMEEFNNGNIPALEEIFQRYKKPLLNFAIRILGSLAEAEDAVSETFYILLRKKQAYEPCAKFTTWVYTVLRRRCIDRIRARKRLFFPWFRKDGSDEYEEMDIPDLKPLPFENLERQDMAYAVKEKIGRLPLAYREALILREYNKLGYAEIARVLDCSVEKVKVLIFRARERLKDELLPIMEEAR
jgi:RNA polymerase sigma-70 factor (ECF subfamily)